MRHLFKCRDGIPISMAGPTGLQGSDTMRLFSLRPLLALCAIVAALAFIVSDADARAGRGGSFGSRGAQTHSSVPGTNTAPNAVRPMERSTTQQPSAAPRTAAPTTTGAGGFFNRPGFMGGLFGGLLGAGLIGMLMGHGFGGGLGGMASILGLMLQIGIIALVAYLIWTWWQRRQQPAMASGPALRDTGSGATTSQMGLGSMLGFGGGSGGAAAPEQRAAGTDEVGLTPEDFNTFERILADAQTAYSNENLNALRSVATPEMVSYYSEGLSENASRGVVNHVSDVKLLQGDLAEAWSEDGVDYATVAMRYALKDTMVDRASGQVVETMPSEATEVWTFMRVRGGKWLVSAVQQPEA
jgi:predicted lipid-binding transport protein (Tim44 family)